MQILYDWLDYIFVVIQSVFDLITGNWLMATMFGLALVLITIEKIQLIRSEDTRRKER